MSRTTLVLLGLALAAGGCSTAEVRSVGVHPLKNAEGHVIGQKEVLRANGETTSYRHAGSGAPVLLLCDATDSRFALLFGALARGGRVIAPAHPTVVSTHGSQNLAGSLPDALATLQTTPLEARDQVDSPIAAATIAAAQAKRADTPVDLKLREREAEVSRSDRRTARDKKEALEHEVDEAPEGVGVLLGQPQHVGDDAHRDVLGVALGGGERGGGVARRSVADLPLPEETGQALLADAVVLEVKVHEEFVRAGGAAGPELVHGPHAGVAEIASTAPGPLLSRRRRP